MMTDDLDDIPTQWPDVNDPTKFVGRYALAIRAYLRVLLPTEHDVDDVEQEIMLKMLQGKMIAQPERGRFRAYLKTIVRNEAISWLRRRRPTYAIPDELTHTEQVWDQTYAQCLLASVWRMMQDRSALNPNEYGVLKLASDHPQATSDELAAQWAKANNIAYSATTFRKQLSRSRRMFAHVLKQVVARDLVQPLETDIHDELRTLGLWSYIENYLE